MTTHNKIIALVEKGQKIKTLQKKYIKFFNQRKSLLKFNLRHFSAFRYKYTQNYLERLIREIRGGLEGV